MLVEQKLQLELSQLTHGEPTDVGARMIVVSWMVEVAEEFRLQQETLHMAVLLLDRFLGSVSEVGSCVGREHADQHQYWSAALLSVSLQLCWPAVCVC